VDAPQTATVPLRFTDFPNAAALRAEADRNGEGELTAWRQAIARLGEDGNVAALFPFWQDGELPATAAAVGAEWTEGRWPQKQALDFHSPSDRLRFHIAGALPALTLLARVRVDALTNDYNALLLPTHYTKGSLHWILERGGELRLTMLGEPRAPISSHGWDGPVSAPAVSSMDLGRWICLATTYDSATGEVIHYCDGREAGRGQFARHLPAQLGDVEFGNWGADGSSPDNAWTRHQRPNQRQRHFTGRLDFLTIIRRVLTAEELRPLMQP
jgi:Concanavalin A-like lectin/glucanases superfamily